MLQKTGHLETKRENVNTFDFFIKLLKASFKITVAIIQQDLRVRNGYKN